MPSRSIRAVLDEGEGILRLAPTFVPRRFNQPGRRLRLHPDDYYALGTARGAIKERWFASTIAAMNGPLASPEEGMSRVATSDDPADTLLFRDAVAELGSDLVGDELWTRYGGWPMYAKFFDYQLPLFHHLHLGEEAAQLVGKLLKPEAYYFPPQLNNHLGAFPVTYFGYDPDTTRAQVRERLLQFEAADNRITELSRAYRIELGTGWYTPPGVVHAPGSVLTYEPQWNSDVNSVHENIVGGEIYGYDFLVENCPPDRQRDIEYILSLMDWERNVDPHYKAHYFRPPLPAQEGEGFTELWITYANPYISAKELTVLPGQTAVVRDGAAFGCILVQGHGRFGVHPAEAAGMLRYGQLSADEFFVGEAAARAGVTIQNDSRWEPLVMLKHFGPNHPDAPQSVDGAGRAGAADASQGGA